MCRANHYAVCVCVYCATLRDWQLSFFCKLLNTICILVHMTEYRQGDVIKCMYSLFIRLRASYLDWGAIGYSYRHPVGRERKEYKSETVKTRKKTRKCESFIELLVQHTCTYME